MNEISLESSASTPLTIKWFVIGLLVIRVPGVMTLAYFFQPLPEFMYFVIELLSYSIMASFIWIERRKLKDYHIGKLTLLVFIIFGGFLRLNTFTSSIHILLYLMFLAVAIILIRSLKRSSVKLTIFQKKDFLWIAIGISAGVFLSIILAIPEMLKIDPYYFPKETNVIATFIAMIMRSFDEIQFVISEEMFFRSILWGYLRKTGWKDIWIWLFQAVLFGMSHTNYFAKPYTFWVAVPVGGLALGLLSWRSREVSTSIVMHATYNSMGSVVNRILAHYLF